KPEQSEPSVKENSLAVEIGRIAKLFALYLLKDTKDEGVKVNRLNSAGFSVPEIAALLDKTEQNVRVQISQAKTRKAKGT
ncbi:MAG: sigma-70 region 4 domain-containing protein, partial [Acidobacteriia bacterium]|nr:sigma-70 region 4 domain-containing protein [Terriglobia bacterium]